MRRFKIFLYLITLAVVFLLGAKAVSSLVDLYKENGRLHEELIRQSEKYKQLNDHAAQLKTKYVEQETLYEEAKRRFAEVSKRKDERIKLLSDATYLMGRHVEKQEGPDYRFQTERGTRNFVLNEIRIQGGESPPVGYILIKHDGRTYKRNYKTEIKVETLQTVDESTGRIRVFSKAFLVQSEPSLLEKRLPGYKSWNGKKYPLDIVGGTAVVDPTVRNQLKSRFHLWAPHLNANINFVGREVAPGLGVSLAGYGSIKNDLTFRFLQLGAHYNDELGVQGTFTPVLWRPFPSLLVNTYVGPGAVLKENGIGYFIGIQVGL